MDIDFNMWRLFKKMLLILAGLAVIIILGLAFFIFTGPDLPPGTDEIIDKVLLDEPPEMIVGDTGRVMSGEVSIWYESISTSDTPRATVLLIMGIANHALAWPSHFYMPMVDSGYRVVLYDHRGLGLSDWMEDWDADKPYTLDDMVDDGLAVLDCLGVEKAHIIGASMGGMIAQQMAITHPERVLSLTSIMSSGYIEDPELPGIPGGLLKEFIRLGLRYGTVPSERNTIKIVVASRQLLMGDTIYELDLRKLAGEVLFEMRKRRGYNPKVNAQHLAATSASGSRYDKLDNIEVPVLIIHGRSDPLIPIEHGQQCARLMPDADTLWVDGMGHDIPEIFMDEILEMVFKNFRL
jgi:pimeloyl-ACP methyl ester carboxylesterase